MRDIILHGFDSDSQSGSRGIERIAFCSGGITDMEGMLLSRRERSRRLDYPRSSPDADIIVTGHSHNEWVFPITRLRLTQKGTAYKDRQTHIKIPTYKDDYGDGSAGWVIERGMPPKPIGAFWIKFSWFNREDRFTYEITRAQ